MIRTQTAGCSIAERLGILVFSLTFIVISLPSQEKNLAVDLGNGIQMEFVLIPAGTFLMGSRAGDPNEQPVHIVTISKPFYIGKYEVTQEQWQTLMDVNPSRFQDPKKPVENVSWTDCQEFIAKLRPRTGELTPSLPTEAQWEYACRAGSSNLYHHGSQASGLKDYAWFNKNSKGMTQPVGLLKPNAWGLYDMLGNVYEWCQDFYSPDTYTDLPVEDPKGPESGLYRVARGGSWSFHPLHCRIPKRFWNAPEFRFNNLGFRLVLLFP